VSDRREWLAHWCPTCRAAPGTRCRRDRLTSAEPAVRLHVARGWRERRCPTCKAWPDEPCRTPSGREACQVHSARLGPVRDELVSRDAVWVELERHGATIAVVPFSGRAGRGAATTATITLSRAEGEARIDVERWSSRDELAYALEAPVWDRFGLFAGQPFVRGEVIWTVEDRSVAIVGKRGDAAFAETVS
jgi:hypothetical protein